STLLALALVTVAPLAGQGVPLLGIAQAQAQTVNQISVSGNVRVDEATILSYLALRPGQVATAANIEASRQALAASGLFQNVSVVMSGNTLNVQVVESTAVSSVAFQGNRRFTTAQLNTMVDVATRRVYTQEGIAGDIQTIQAAYDQAGYTNVSVTTRTETAS